MKKLSVIFIGSAAILGGIAIILHCSNAKYTGTKMLFKSAADMIAALGIILVGILLVFAGIRISSSPKTATALQNEPLSPDDFKSKTFGKSGKSKDDEAKRVNLLNLQEEQHRAEKGELYARIQAVQLENNELSSEVNKLSSEVSKLSSELKEEKEKNDKLKKEMIKALFENYQHMSETAKKLLELLGINVKKSGARNWKLTYNDKSVSIPQQLSAKSKKNKNDIKKIIDDVLGLIEE